jgi:hypothetical protein
MTYDRQTAGLIHDLSAERCLIMLEKTGLAVTGRERESVEWLRFKVEQAYCDGTIADRDILLEWLHDQGWTDILRSGGCP